MAPCPQAFGSFSTAAGHFPPACWRPYSDNSIFNRLIPPHPKIAKHSRAIIRYMSQNRWSFGGYARNRLELLNSASRPVYWSTASDPLVSVICGTGNSCQHGMRVHIPAGATPAPDSDGEMIVVDQAEGREFDFWRATVPGNGVMYVSSGNSLAIGPDRGRGLYGDASASYFGGLGGMLRISELQAGVINHALVMVVPCVQWHDIYPSPRRGHGDSVCPGGHVGPHFGTRLQLKMSDRRIDRTHAPRWQKAIMHAMHDYGVYVVDTDGPAGQAAGWMTLDTESDDPYAGVASFPVGAFAHPAAGGTIALGSKLRPSQFRVIAPCVTRGRCR